MKNEIELLWKFDDVKDSSLVGYIECAKCELESVFGRPTNEYEGNEVADDGKVQHEWWLKINGTALTIYDYKMYREIDDDEKITWHIGSSSIQALFELMVVGFDSSQVLTCSDYREKLFRF
jgi:hypothetical protein